MSGVLHAQFTNYSWHFNKYNNKYKIIKRKRGIQGSKILKEYYFQGIHVSDLWKKIIKYSKKAVTYIQMIS